MGRRYVLAIGRSREGIHNENTVDEEKIHLMFMLLADEKARDYLQKFVAGGGGPGFEVSVIEPPRQLKR